MSPRNTSACRPASLLAFVLGGLLLAPSLLAVTLRELKADQKLTPKRFANHFENFAYEFVPYVQYPEVFLRRRAGDCDDYAILADHILREKGYQTRIVHVSLLGSDIGHAVCYVDEDRVYLDYNNRRFFFNLTRCDRSIRAIATKVAKSFDRNWTTAAVYTYDYDEDRKKRVMTVVKTDDPALDPDRTENLARP